MLDNQHGTVPEMTMQETEDLRNRLTKDLQDMRRKKALRVTVYVEGKYRDSYDIAKSWAHEKGLTKKKSHWAFCKFAITNTIKMIVDEIERERNAPPEMPDEPDISQELTIA